MKQRFGDCAEYGFFAWPNAAVECRLALTPNGQQLQIFGNRLGLLSLANVFLWFLANAYRREFLALAELPFVRLEGDLSVCMRLTVDETRGSGGTVCRLDRGASLEWILSEDDLRSVALLLHRLVSKPGHQYDLLEMRPDSACEIHIRMTDAPDWVARGIV
jgi:hypothetical protein